MFKSPRHAIIKCWKVAGAFWRPKGILLHLKSSIGIIVNAVLAFTISDSSTSTCQYPEVKSSILKYFAFPLLSRSSSIRGNDEKVSLTVFSFMKSMQSLNVPSFFATISGMTLLVVCTLPCMPHCPPISVQPIKAEESSMTCTVLSFIHLSLTILFGSPNDISTDQYWDISLVLCGWC